jgi:Zn-dependent M16 (insulinase) family peptidase
MGPNTMLLKAASFLTSLIKSKNMLTYAKEGFDGQDLKQETIDIIKDGPKLQDEQIEKFEHQINEEIPRIIDCLVKEQLVDKTGNKYFITEKAMGLADFMLELSSVMTLMNDDFSKKDIPYKHYPGSSDVYGLN